MSLKIFPFLTSGKGLLNFPGNKNTLAKKSLKIVIFSSGTAFAGQYPFAPLPL
jgi:hypothetical protein